MRVLIGCERSGRVRDTFIKRGHEALSCDLLPTDSPVPHYQGDVRDLLSPGSWDLFIVHPDCTYLTGAAEWCYKDDPGKKMQPGVLFGIERRIARAAALNFVRELMAAPIPRIALENPVGKIGTEIRKADQWIQPYDYGDDASKKTGLWLKNLPKLVSTKYIAPRIVNGKERWGNQTDSGQNKLGPSEDRAKLRSLTYQGWADAMAGQWGRL